MRGNPSVTASSLRPRCTFTASRSRSRTMTSVVTRALASRQSLATTLLNEAASCQHPCTNTSCTVAKNVTGTATPAERPCEGNGGGIRVCGTAGTRSEVGASAHWTVQLQHFHFETSQKLFPRQKKGKLSSHGSHVPLEKQISNSSRFWGGRCPMARAGQEGTSKPCTPSRVRATSTAAEVVCHRLGGAPAELQQETIRPTGQNALGLVRTTLRNNLRVHVEPRVQLLWQHAATHVTRDPEDGQTRPQSGVVIPRKSLNLLKAHHRQQKVRSNQCTVEQPR